MVFVIIQTFRYDILDNFIVFHLAGLFLKPFSFCSHNFFYRPLIVIGGSCDAVQEAMGGFQAYPQVIIGFLSLFRLKQTGINGISSKKKK